MQLVQLNIFNEQEVVSNYNKTNYNDFLKKFETKKTTDDCYTPDGVYNAVTNYVENFILKPCGKSLNDYEILRPFKPFGDYLNEKYTDKMLVIDNPPFSIYAKIVKNYLKMNVKFFLFAPALTLFVLNSECQYIITNVNITYSNGAKVRTSFATNLLPSEYKILLSGRLTKMLKQAQATQNKQKLKILKMPDNYFSSAQLLKYVPTSELDIPLCGSSDYISSANGRKIFGAAMHFTNNDVEFLKGKQDDNDND